MLFLNPLAHTSYTLLVGPARMPFINKRCLGGDFRCKKLRSLLPTLSARNLKRQMTHSAPENSAAKNAAIHQMKKPFAGVINVLSAAVRRTWSLSSNRSALFFASEMMRIAPRILAKQSIKMHSASRTHRKCRFPSSQIAAFSKIHARRSRQ